MRVLPHAYGALRVRKALCKTPTTYTTLPARMEADLYRGAKYYIPAVYWGLVFYLRYNVIHICEPS